MVDTQTDSSATTSATTPAELIVVSGLSGSGKTVALRTLEDLGYYCVDNLPAALMPAFVQAISQGAAGLHHKLAVGVDVRNRAENLNRLPAILAELAQAQIAYRLVFLDTRDDMLIMVDDERLPLKAGEKPQMLRVRFRTLGCYPLSGAIRSDADTLDAIIAEMRSSTSSERQGRLIDHDEAGSMEKKKREGYF